MKLKTIKKHYISLIITIILLTASCLAAISNTCAQETKENQGIAVSLVSKKINDTGVINSINFFRILSLNNESDKIFVIDSTRFSNNSNMLKGYYPINLHSNYSEFQQEELKVRFVGEIYLQYIFSLTGIRIFLRGYLPIKLTDIQNINTNNNTPPTADFTINPLSATIQQEINFQDQSYDIDGEIKSWHWDFSDANTSELQNPKHSYSTPGEYTVSLTVEDDSGDTDSTNSTVTISQQNNIPPEADFNFSPSNPKVDESINFDGSISTDSDGCIISYNWCFGDGNSSNKEKPVHSYSKPGQYNVSLIVEDNQGATDEIIKTVQVTQSPPLNYTLTVQIVDNEQCSGNTIPNPGIYTYSPAEKVQLQAIAVLCAGYGFTHWEVNGEIIESYNIEIEMNSDKTAIAYYECILLANIEYSPQHPIVGDNITLKAEIVESPCCEYEIESYEWEITSPQGLSESFYGKEITLPALQSGTYQVNLTILEATGLTYSTSREITVNDIDHIIVIKSIL